VVATNDFIKDFIDQSLILTNDEKDRIGKEEMKKLFNAQFPDKHLNIQQLISNLRDKGVKYHTKYRHNNLQGCFICVKLKDQTEQHDNPLEHGIEHVDMSVDCEKEYQNEINKLKNEIICLKKLLVDNVTTRLSEFIVQAQELKLKLEKTQRLYETIQTSFMEQTKQVRQQRVEIQNDNEIDVVDDFDDVEKINDEITDLFNF